MALMAQCSQLLQPIPDIWIHSKSCYNVVFSTYLRSNAARKKRVSEIGLI